MSFESNHPEVLRRVEAAVLKSLSEAGMLVKTDAKLRCPVDTGNLRKSITSEVKQVDRSAEIGTNVEYAQYVEYGTKRTRAQPYLRPAGDENRDKIERIFQKNLKATTR